MEMNDMVRAKFKVTEVQPAGGDNGTRVVLVPVIDGSEENKEFYRWTPGGAISLDTINAAAAAQFEVGAEFYVDFTRA